MKGVRKCFSSSSMLLALPVLSFLVTALNVGSANALRHEMTTIPLGSNKSYYNQWTGYAPENPRFRVRWYKNSTYNIDFHPQNLSIVSPRHFYTYYDSTYDQCKYNSSSANAQYYGYSDNSHSISNESSYYEVAIGFESYYNNYVSQSSFPKVYSSAMCLQLAPFGDTLGGSSNLLQHPEWDDSSLVNIPLASRPLYINLPPYYYSYDSFYLRDSAVDSGGVHYSNTLHFSDVFDGFVLNKFESLTIPLGQAYSDKIGSVTSGRPITYDGVFDFSGEGHTFEWSPLASSYGYFKLYYSGVVSGSRTNSSGSVNCTTNFVSLEFNNFYQLTFSCPFTAPVDFEDDTLYFWLGMGIDRTSFSTIDETTAQNMYLFSVNADWTFSSAYFTTDNDSTPGVGWSKNPTGNNLASAPGSAQGLINDQGSADWFSSLVNMFNFTFLNPFSSLFAMFTDSSTCVQIPTLSGMLNSNETQYCSWFSSTTRQILTPVLSITGIMLVFGFIVRWLGSSSGNFFEDSKIEEVSNYGGRWGHFKKKGK